MITKEVDFQNAIARTVEEMYKSGRSTATVQIGVSPYGNGTREECLSLGRYTSTFDITIGKDGCVTVAGSGKDIYNFELWTSIEWKDDILSTAGHISRTIVNNTAYLQEKVGHLRPYKIDMEFQTEYNEKNLKELREKLEAKNLGK